MLASIQLNSITNAMAVTDIFFKFLLITFICTPFIGISPIVWAMVLQCLRHLFRLFLSAQILFEQGGHGFVAFLGAVHQAIPNLSS